MTPKSLTSLNCRRTSYMALSLLLLASLSLNCCGSMGDSLRDQRIPKRHLLMLPREGKLHITWEARHLIVTVKGTAGQGILSLNGHISRNRDAIQFVKLDNMLVDIYFANSAGKVLKHAVLHSTDRPPSGTILHRFRSSYQLPKSTSHIAFGYDLKAGSRLLRHFAME